jgi:hypothetical protein
MAILLRFRTELSVSMGQPIGRAGGSEKKQDRAMQKSATSGSRREHAKSAARPNLVPAAVRHPMRTSLCA